MALLFFFLFFFYYYYFLSLSQKAELGLHGGTGVSIMFTGGNINVPKV